MKHTIAVATAAALAVLGTACSSSTAGHAAGGSSSGGRPAAIPASGGSKGPTAAPPTGSIPAGSGGLGAAAWCGELVQNSSVSLTNPSSTLPPGYAARAQKLVDDAPPEIRPDVNTITTADEQVAAGHPDADATPQFLQAGQHLVQWLQANCPDVLKKFNPGIGSALPTG
jgi:hypothetical protein